MSASFDSYAILELLGHRRLVGHVTEATLFGATMIKLEALGWDHKADDYTTATQYYASSSLYALTPISEEDARAQVKPRYFDVGGTGRHLALTGELDAKRSADTEPPELEDEDPVDPSEDRLPW